MYTYCIPDPLPLTEGFGVKVLATSQGREAIEGREGNRGCGKCSIRGDLEDWRNQEVKCPHLKLGLRERTLEKAASELTQGGKDRWDLDRQGEASSNKAMAGAQA